MKLSIIIPVFNEEKTVSKILPLVSEVKIKDVEKEIIAVDDGSTDATQSKITKSIRELGRKNFKFLIHKKNLGKGAAVRTGIKNATGDYIIIQDADLEYDPNFIPLLVSNLKSQNDVIYGTRLQRMPHFGGEERNIRFLFHYLGNRFLSLVTSLLYGQWITDMETCYKLFPKKALNGTVIKARGFEFEPEITAKLLKKGFKIKEVPISATPRGYDEGKKLNTFSDGFAALWALLKYRFID